MSASEVIGLLVLAGIVIALIMSARLRAAAALAAANTVRQWHTADVKRTHAKLTALKQDADANADHIEKLEAKLAEKRDQMATKAKAEGLSADEIIARLKRLGL